MKVSIGKYENIQINNGAPLYTKHVFIEGEDGRRLGGVDHFMKKSTRQLVNYYVRRIKKEQWVGKFTINIILRKGMFGEVVKTNKIGIVAE